jgi:hypothetical protein
MSDIKAEISFDLVMDEDMSFVEGTYRLPNGNWQVFIFSRFRDIASPVVSFPAKWESGITGVHVAYPCTGKLDKAEVFRVLSGTLGVTEWQETRGPDSMELR